MDFEWIPKKDIFVNPSAAANQAATENSQNTDFLESQKADGNNYQRFSKVFFVTDKIKRRNKNKYFLKIAN